jgi:murein DD-endopeptidase MepM/ murein hydrolase activator NlpD
MKTARVLIASILSLLFLAGKVEAQNNTFIKPISGGVITCTFDSKFCGNLTKYHTAIDYVGAGNRVDVLASNCGVVSLIQRNNGNDLGFGNTVILRHNVIISSSGKTDTVYTMYAHLESIADLRVGRAVSKGQKIGVMGGSGNGKANRWGKHLHFEVKYGNKLTNPSGRGTTYGYSPDPAAAYGYVNPANVIGRWRALCATPSN